MGERINAIRGMNDVLPADGWKWLHIESTFMQILQSYGYQHLRSPIVESTSLYKRSIGEITDIVSKEMYTFADLNGDSLTLRPEGTAGCVRACLEHSLLHNQQQKLWYCGPMYRHERPQKGRYRQFYQFGVEAFGLTGPGIELEMILIAKAIFSSLQIYDNLRLEINTLGNLAERDAYKIDLVAFLQDNFDELDNDSKIRLEKNPLRILDSKNPQIQDLLQQAPKLIDYLATETKQHFDSFCQSLTDLGIEYSINPRLVRGLDYYGDLVFEWVTDSLGSQGTVCAGGRFDGLVAQLGGKPCPAIGFAIGIERLLLLMEELGSIADNSTADIYLIVESEVELVNALQLADIIRKDCAKQVVVNLSFEKFKNQFKKADKSGASLALILGSSEVSSDLVSIKNLRAKSEQQTIAQSELIKFITEYFNGEHDVSLHV